MNKISLALSVTAVTALVGCLDPKYNGKVPLISQTTPSTQPSVQQQAPVEVEPTPVQVTEPTTIEIEPIAPAPEPPQPIQVKPEPVTPQPPVAETTTYIVQPGDSLSKISKRYNISIAAIKRENPKIKNDTIILGQKIKLPGKVDVGEQTVPAGAFARPQKKATATSVKEHTPYKGATKEYVVKSGDILGTIAQKHGCTVRQLKEMNGLTSDKLRIGQKLKVPAGKTAGAAANDGGKSQKPTVSQTKSPEPVKPVGTVKPTGAKPVVTVEEPELVTPVPVADPVEEPAPVAPVVVPAPSNDYDTYTVQDGDDITGISIHHSVSPTEIRQLNNLSDDAELKPGMTLRLPAGSIQ